MLCYWQSVEKTLPEKSGTYIVAINYEGEYGEYGSCLSQPSKYITIMDVAIEEDCDIYGNGNHDEMWEEVYAWVGPLGMPT